MREIKFRAWDIEEQKMYYHVQNTYDYMRGEPEPVPENSFGDLLENRNWRWKVMQYVGMEDRDGNGIYEGDIIVCHAKNYDYIGVIEYDETYDTGSYGLHTKTSTNEHMDLIMSRFAGDSKEVLGNIYENPTLLDELWDKQIHNQWRKYERD